MKPVIAIASRNGRAIINNLLSAAKIKNMNHQKMVIPVHTSKCEIVMRDD
jgi:hypothetical protein